MLKKLILVQKLDRKVRECDEMNECIGPMLKLLTAEKNKLMIQRLEIESELRQMGQDPRAILKSLGLESSSGTAEIEDHLLASSFDETLDQDEESASGLYEEDLNLDQVGPVDLIYLKHGEVEEEEEDDDDEEEEELKEWINNNVELKDGVFCKDISQLKIDDEEDDSDEEI
ncbi:nucleomorphin-like [Neocloeon triangulifer]|uniref:nucleomorphin-like n=1 Tax=Neocloeon triangulifer TaxID=2078957 RepID=UPI00286ED086|nr:nucleomorphin-like [Neocloeon triangulifer]XP_059490281.1 nucleomorphin-like [Neocloeon triangulifer]XP_059490282.1 nucleomorphin-like [Neocloeon triangulifer]XP_059490283.1 nucleomorphin-like [Neocloeon triangulifer]